MQYDSDGDLIPLISDKEVAEMKKENADEEAAEGEAEDDADPRRVYINSKIHQPKPEK